MSVQFDMGLQEVPRPIWIVVVVAGRCEGACLLDKDCVYKGLEHHDLTSWQRCRHREDQWQTAKLWHAATQILRSRPVLSVSLLENVAYIRKPGRYIKYDAKIKMLNMANDSSNCVS
jgi:hypothetical protein